MWEQLVVLIGKWSDGEWCLGDDFNAIEMSSVDCRCLQRSRDSVGFNDFTGIMDLVDFPTRAIKFSWSKGSGGSMSIINRSLLSNGFIELLSAVSQEIRPKDLSDHSLV
ncbi:unnamed protein product [Vicia faba]|uniref:Uncharacterized protein n=1 Tax=Vicia faba TaxID=3906 RepID=A0AAV1AD37_VICFA|nr:unnamed protein product [Vicia faba]